MSEAVTYASKDRIATITINRPEAMNALNEAVVQGLYAAWSLFRDGEDRCADLRSRITVISICMLPRCGRTATWRRRSWENARS